MFIILLLLGSHFCFKPEDLTWTYFNGEKTVTFLATIPDTTDFKVSLSDVFKLLTCLSCFLDTKRSIRRVY